MATHQDWKGRTGGMPWMQRTLIVWLRWVDVRVLYVVMAMVIPFYIAAGGAARRAVYHYFRQRHGQSSLRAAWSVVRNYYVFGQIILDRFAAFAGQKFDIAMEGHEAWQELAAGADGFAQVSAHVGNFELSGYLLTSTTKRVNALVYGGETSAMMQHRAAIFGEHNVRMVAAADDMSHVFTLSAALADGEIVSMPGDRVFGSPRTVEARLLGATADFPAGPFALAATRGLPMVAVFVMKEGAHRYRAIVRRLPDAADATVATRKRLQDTVQAYADVLTDVLTRYPLQWFNYFEFWKPQPTQ